MQYICVMCDIYPFGNEQSYMSVTVYSQNKSWVFQVYLALLGALYFAFPDNCLAKRLAPTCPASLTVV